jgi:hypothetical protein
MTTRGHPDDLFSARKRNAIPFEFVLDELAGVDSWTRSMCGCAAVSMGERIVFIQRDKKDREDGEKDRDDEGAPPLAPGELPNLRSITVFGVGETGWQMLPVDAGDFQ